MPTTYDISGSYAPGAYNGQKRRIAQLQEIVDSSRNEPISWDLKAAIANTQLNQFASTAAQGNSNLRTKIDELNVFYSNGTQDATEAWMLTRQLGYENNYVLQGGLNYWAETIMNPQAPKSTSSDDEASDEDVSTLYVGNLPYRANEQIVKEHFETITGFMALKKMESLREIEK